VTVLAVTQFMGKGKCEACTTEIHQCQTAATAYMVDPGTALPLTCAGLYPTTLLTPLKYGGAWTIDGTTGKVTASCSPTYCATPSP
jgi:hypothetical protein